MGRAPCCEKTGLKKGPWTSEEDQKLIDYISENGYGNWRTLPTNAGLERCGKSCRLRWTNYLRPDIKRGRFSFEEEETIIQLHSILGNKWSAIASRLPGRTDNEIKNYWNTHIRKKLLRMGIDPVTHNPRIDLLDLSSLLYHNNQHLSKLMAMHQSEDTLRIGSFLMSSQPDNSVTNSLDPTRMNQDQYYYDINQNEFDHQQSAQFSNNVIHDSNYYVPIHFNDFSNQDQIPNNSYLLGQPDGDNLIMNNSVISTPSSSPNSNIYMNSSCCSSNEDEKEINNNRIDDYCSNEFVKMMKFDIVDQIFDVSEFIC